MQGSKSILEGRKTMVIKYRIVYIRPQDNLSSTPFLAWCEEQDRFISAELRLYTTNYSTLEEAMKRSHELKRRFSGWYDGIYIDSFRAA